MDLKIFDTHAHYDSESFDNDREKIINTQFDFGVRKILNCAVDINSSGYILNLVSEYDFIYGACGVHPNYSENYYKNNRYIYELYEYHKNNKILAVGEIGLDYFYKNVNIEIQKKIFKDQLDLAKEINKPVIIHCRNAFDDTLNIIRDFNLRGVIHCFSGSYELAKQFINCGFYLGIGGVLTFKNAKTINDVVRKIPTTYLLTETDCPYLSPEPLRGKRNESVNIKYIIKKIAEIKQDDFYKIADTLYNNALNFLNL